MARWGSLHKWGDSCALCANPATERIVIRAGHVAIASGHKRSITVARAIPICAQHAAHAQLVPDRATVAARAKLSARSWRLRQLALFDSLVYKR